MDENQKKIVQQMIDKALTKAMDFPTKKKGDTPTDAYQLTPQKYVNANGSIAGRPIGSVAFVGQFYYASDVAIPIFFDGQRWRNGVGSIVASN